MTDILIYKVLKQVKKGAMPYKKYTAICERLAQMGYLTPLEENGLLKGYDLTINGKIFIWDNENWKL